MKMSMLLLGAWLAFSVVCYGETIIVRRVSPEHAQQIELRTMMNNQQRMMGQRGQTGEEWWAAKEKWEKEFNSLAREWKNQRGESLGKGIFLSRDDRYVTLRVLNEQKAYVKTKEIIRSQLSKEDQAWVQAEISRRKEAEKLKARAAK